jgi:hypothetical protein
MSRVIELNLRPDTATLRQFGWIALGAFALLAVAAWRDWLIFSFGLGEARPAVVGGLACLAALCGLFAAFWPEGNRPIYVGLTLLAFPIGLVLSYVILGTLFFLIISPIGLLLRLTGHDPMQRAFPGNATSYWSDARPSRPPRSYFRQF